MKVYALYDGSNKLICEVDVETVSWLPVRPKISRKWLRRVIQDSLQTYFKQERSVVKT